jgi:hypothetical protein
VSKGSWIVDDVSRHLKACTQCRTVDPESKRVKHAKPGQVSESDVPAEALAAMCPDGRAVFLRWLIEPE